MRRLLHWSWLFTCLTVLEAFLNRNSIPMPRKPLSETSSDFFTEGNSDSRESPPLRKDVCRVFVTGILGQEPKETYLANDHYVINFPLAVVGHFSPIHDWERLRPSETMWIGVEAWDELAKGVSLNYTKGSKLAGVALLLHNKWKDKVTGEDRKQFKLRLTKVMSEEDLREMVGDLELDGVGIEDTDIPPSETDFPASPTKPVAMNAQDPPLSNKSRTKIRF